MTGLVRGRVGRTMVAVVVASVSMVVAACAVPAGSGGNDAADPAARVPGGQATADLEVEVLGRRLELLEGDGTRRQLAVLGDGDGEVVAVAPRPGERAPSVVLVLTRLEGDETVGPRYELRYLVVDEDGPSELFWFPWRLQVDETLATVLDVPPLPVWAPDGSAVAWIEWVEEGTRLRTVGWLDDEDTSNPTDEAAAYVLEDVPSGVQLEAWETGTDGRAVLTGRVDGEVWRIHVDPGAGTIAQPVVPSAGR